MQNALVGRLHHCKQTGEGKWLARCPAHKDSSPSLSIKELRDGRILVHCHAGCSTLDVLASVGLDWSDLFPPDEHYPARRTSAPQESVDELVVEIAVSDIANGKTLSDSDEKRYQQACLRLGREKVRSIKDAARIRLSAKDIDRKLCNQEPLDEVDRELASLMGKALKCR